jgi:hypothetical protein
MYFDNCGLVTDDQGDQRIYIAWRHVHGIMKWLQDGKSYLTYPGHSFTRQQVGFLLAYYGED